MRFESTLQSTTSYMKTDGVTSTFENDQATYTYSLVILKGLQFNNVNNSMYAFLNKSSNDFSSNEMKIYRMIASSLSIQIKAQMKTELEKDYIKNVTINKIFFKYGFKF